MLLYLCRDRRLWLSDRRTVMSPFMPQSLVLSTAKAAILALGPSFDTLLKIEQEQDFDDEVPVDWQLVFAGFYQRFKLVRART
jgi:hypothetical protein